MGKETKMKNLLKDDEDKIRTQKTEKKEAIPDDLHTIYLNNKNEMRKDTSFLGTYFKLLTSIDIGKEMLPSDSKFDTLRNDALAILKNKDHYPKDKKVEVASSGDKYFINSDTSGTIVVAVDKIQEGIDEAGEQQATKIVPKLREIDTKIFRALIKENIILVKRFDIKNMVGDIIEKAIKEGMLDKLKEKMIKDGKST